MTIKIPLHILRLPKAIPYPFHHFADSLPLDELQRRYIAWLPEQTGSRIGGRDGAAEILGIKRTNLNARMKKSGCGEESL